MSTVRLHITPLSPDLLDAILGPSLRSCAATVSYHTVQTAPDQSFGYVELPVMDATKIKKKLNGAILKGKKLKIEEARPRKRSHAESEEASPESEPSVSRRSKRTKADANTLAGHELSPDRIVKRGWTEPRSDKKSGSKKDKTKSQASSKHTEQAELLFRTKIPANKVSEEVKEKRKKSKKGENADVVHEFAKATAMPSFLRHEVDPAAKQAVEYKDGKGWVDQDGAVVEEETPRASKKRKAAKQGLEIDISKAEAVNLQRVSNKLPLSPPPSKSNSTADNGVDQVEDDTSSSGSSSESSSSEDADEESDAESTPDEDVDKVDINEATTAVHPLEALFKKPQIPTPATNQTTPRSNAPSSASSRGSGKTKPTLELSTSFSFFGNGVDDDDDDGRSKGQQATPHTNDISHDLPQMPMTPFSTQDYRVRQIRSAAPTPDTGDIRKSTGYGSLILGEDDPDDVLSDGGEDNDNKNNNNNTTTRSSQGSLPKSDFEKRFWEQRGENNRAWKARRRAVLKEQRQRENRARRPRGF